MEKIIHYYFDESNESRQFTFSLEANPESLKPDNALRVAPEFIDGYFPCERDGLWFQIEDHRNKVVYSIESKESLEIKQIGLIPSGYTLLEPKEFDKWDGSKWVLDEETFKKSLVPSRITKRQAMLQLNKSGLYQSTLDLINSTENLDLKIEFDCTTEFDRNNQFIAGVAKNFGLSDDDVDTLFINASKL